jgi:hypothetical protein
MSYVLCLSLSLSLSLSLRLCLGLSLSLSPSPSLSLSLSLSVCVCVCVCCRLLWLGLVQFVLSFSRAKSCSIFCCLVLFRKDEYKGTDNVKIKDENVDKDKN